MTAESDNQVQDNKIEPNAERIKLWTEVLESVESLLDSHRSLSQHRNVCEIFDEDGTCTCGLAEVEERAELALQTIEAVAFGVAPILSPDAG